MAMDYHERKIASRNKPRRSSIWGYVLGVASVLILVYAAGVASGWFACRYRMKTASAVAPSTQPKAQGQPSPNSPTPVDAKPVPAQTPLTFYETLPQGSKTVIGSGINAKLPPHDSTAPARPASAAPPSAPAPAAVSPKPASAPPAPAASQPPPKPAPVAPPVDKPVPAATKEVERHFTVQVASVKEKSEAETLKSRLAAKGLNPYVIAVNVPGKGLLYRVRAGRHLLQSEAQDIAAKLGSGAIAIPE